jgi:AcrR family transcriptional regulator
MPAVSSFNQDSTRERILTAALQIFAEKGYDGARTRDIALLAGVNEVTLFRLFGNKSALFEEAVLKGVPLKRILTTVDFDLDLPVEELMARNANMVLDILKQNRHLFMIIVGELWRHPKFKDRLASELYGSAIGFLSHQIRMLMERGMLKVMDPDIAAKALIGMVQSHYLFNYMLGPGDIPPAEEERIIRGMAGIFVHGVGLEEGD